MQPSPSNPMPPFWGQEPAPPSASARTCSSATSALVLAVLGTTCLPLVGSVAAIALGIAALREIRASNGTLSGKALAWSGIAVASVTLMTLTGFLALAALIPSTTTHISRTITTSAPVAPPTTAPTASSAPRAPVETASHDTTTLETKLGSFTLVDVGSDITQLDEELRAQRAKAAKAGEKLVLQTTALSCRPCQGAAAALSDPRMQKALTGVRLVRIDIAEFREELNALGVPHDMIPGYFLLGTDLSPTDGVNGGEWDDDTAENIAPVLGAFVRGKYQNRRQPWKAPSSQHRPGGISL